MVRDLFYPFPKIDGSADGPITAITTWRHCADQEVALLRRSSIGSIAPISNKRLKGKTSQKLLREFEHLRRQYWGRHLWACGYFCCRSGNVTDDVIREYLERQDHDRDSEFKIEGDDTPSS